MNCLNHTRLLGMLMLFAWLYAGCSQSDGPDVSNIPMDVKIIRFDKEVFAIDTNQIEIGLAQLRQKYPEMTDLFTGTLIHDQTNPSETPQQAISGFLKAPQIRKLYDTIQLVYPDLRWLEKDINHLFRHHKYYFPGKPTPKVAAVISEFAVDAFTYGDSLCGIGLDLFLGENFWGYNPEIFPAYIRRQLNRDYIVIRLGKTLAQNAMGETPPGKTLLDMMLYNGKMLYVTGKLLPGTPDSLIMGYTREQMEGSLANEQAVWARLLEQKLLYSTDFDTFKKLVTPSPNAPVVFQEAPGEIGNWVGWQIVKSYMERNPETSFDTLLKMTDAQKFLEAAKYKPKRK
ncbi:MAG: hypothetical protein JNJ57_11530 [Saprospiraceae bacterium]|nr:hypothetical protein [Saprospiraceae bacterium]